MTLSAAPASRRHDRSWPRAWLLLALVCTSSSSSAVTLYSQDFSNVDTGTGLPAGWSLGPPAHIPFFSSALDSNVFAEMPPSIRIDLPLRTLNYRLATPYLQLPHMDRDYTVEFALRVVQPDSPFRVEIVHLDREGNWLRHDLLFSLVGEHMDSLRVLRASFNPRQGAEPGQCWITFGLSYTKVLRAGSFWLDDFALREGHEAESLEFYMWPTTVEAGEDVGVHISSGRESVTMQVWCEEDVPVPVYGPRVVGNLSEQPLPEESWRVGCNWPISATIPVGPDWPSGVYTVKIAHQDRIVWDTFVVRGRGNEGRILVILPTNTGLAHNSWGGGSFYSDPQRPEICFERPHVHGFMGVYQVPIHLIRWLHRTGIGHAVADETDFHLRPELLFSYPGVITPWHSEYWTGEMRRTMELYLASGGSYLCLSGNTCWWQTRMVEADDPVEGGTCRRLICYKYAVANDPYRKIDPSRVTTHWDEPPLNNPPSRFLGLSWRYGGMVNWSASSLCPCDYDWLIGYGGYQVFRTDHWVFDGTGLGEGDTFGQEYAIVGYEVDGAPIEWIDGRPVALPEGGSPPDFQILGYSPCWNNYTDDETGVALMGIIDYGSSYMFNGGTTGWCWGLANDPLVQRVTQNLIDRLGSTPPEHRSTVRLQAYPNPARERVFLKLCGFPLPEQFHVYSILGSRVASLDLSRANSHEASLIWDFRNAAGRPLPTGIYVARADRGPSVSLIHIR